MKYARGQPLTFGAALQVFTARRKPNQDIPVGRLGEAMVSSAPECASILVAVGLFSFPESPVDWSIAMGDAPELGGKFRCGSGGTSRRQMPRKGGVYPYQADSTGYKAALCAR